MNYIEVNIEIIPFTDERSEIVMAMLEELPFESFSVDQPYLKCYIKEGELNLQNLKTVLSFFDNNTEFKVSYSTNFIREENWNKTWEADFNPIFINDLVTIKAPFHHNLPLTKYNIKIEPKMAFGTGHHQTTTLMVKSMLDLNGEGERSGELVKIIGKKWGSIRGKQVLDMGTGTGILAILAAKMGAKRTIHAVDVDITSVNSAKENAYKNRLHNALHILYGDGSIIQRGKYDIILANINRNVLLQDMDTYSHGLKLHGVLVLSGFYTEDIELLKNKAAECGLKMATWSEIDNWASVIFCK
jgi:Ribosomal protein L11 methylase